MLLVIFNLFYNILLGDFRVWKSMHSWDIPLTFEYSNGISTFHLCIVDYCKCFIATHTGFKILIFESQDNDGWFYIRFMKSSGNSFPSNTKSFSLNNTPPTAFYSYLIFSVIASSFHTFLLWVNGGRPLYLWLYLALSENLVFIVGICVVFLNTIVINRQCLSSVFAFMNCF